MDNRTDRQNPQPLLYIAALLVLIIGLLAVLWVKERRQRMSAQQNAANLRHENQTLRNALQAFGTAGLTGAPQTRPGEAPASLPASRPDGR